MQLIQDLSSWELIVGATKSFERLAWMWRLVLTSYPVVRCLGPYPPSSPAFLRSVKPKSSFRRATIPLQPSPRFLRLATTGRLLVPERGPLSGRSCTLLV